MRCRSTRAALVAAARTVFEELGYPDTRIVDIVTAAGTSVGSFYNYFDTKEDIFREVAFAVIDELTAAPRRDPDNPDRDPRRDILFAVGAYVDVCAQHTRVTAAIRQRSHVDLALRDHRARRVAHNADRGAAFIERLQRRGIADPEIDPAMTSTVLQSMVISAVYDHLVLSDEPADLERLTATLAQIWLRAVGLA